jgi:endonuclease YncB( thermonuclease family)
MLKRCFLALLILISPAAALAFQATLQRVFDGDTIDVVDDKGRQFRVRLSGIDAPERGQPFAQRSGESLRRLLSEGPLTVEAVSVDRYQRLLAKVACAGRDAGIEQLRSGLAWFYPWTDSISQSDRNLYRHEEQSARLLHRGLWSDRDAVPPWQFRRAEAAGWPASFAVPRPIVTAEPSTPAHGIVILGDPRHSPKPATAPPVVHKASSRPKKK